MGRGVRRGREHHKAVAAGPRKQLGRRALLRTLKERKMLRLSQTQGWPESHGHQRCRPLLATPGATDPATQSLPHRERKPGLVPFEASAHRLSESCLHGPASPVKTRQALLSPVLTPCGRCSEHNRWCPILGLSYHQCPD